MAWVAVYNNDDEFIFGRCPLRRELTQEWVPGLDAPSCSIRLPRGSIEKLIGRRLTWEDDPVKLEYNL